MDKIELWFIYLMATVARPPIFTGLSISSFSINHTPKTLLLTLPTVRPCHRISKTIISRGGDGDFGARDPFPAEIESNFGDKVLGFKDTEHKILIPNVAALSLAQLKCEPLSHLQPPLSDEDANSLLRKVYLPKGPFIVQQKNVYYNYLCLCA